MFKHLKWIWEQGSNLGVNNLPKDERRALIILNRINFIVIASSLFALIAVVLFYWIAYRTFPQIATTRLLFLMITGLFSIFLVKSGKIHAAKIITSVFPAFFMIVYPALLDVINIDFYFYNPLLGTLFAIFPILLFTERKERKIMIVLVLYCSVISLAYDNILSFISSTESAYIIFGNRYFFYKLALIILYIVFIYVVFTIKKSNTYFENLLVEQNTLLQAQKEEISKQSEEQFKMNEELMKLNKEIIRSNQELVEYKNQLEEMVETRTKALRESEAWFRSIFENANDAIFLLKDSRLFDCNIVTTRIFMASKEELIGKEPYDLSPAKQPDGRDSRAKGDEIMNHVLLHGSQRFEWQHAKSDGTVFESEVSLKRIDFEGQPYVLAIVRDITERKRAEKAIAERESNFREIFNKLRNGILILDAEMRVLAANNTVLRMTGYEWNENIPAYASDFTPPGQSDRIKERLEMMAKGENIPPFDYRVRYNDDSMHIVEAESSPMEFYGKEAFLTVLRDVTQIREHEQRVLEAIIDTEEKERSRIAQDLHDGLGPLLSTIQLYFQTYHDSNDENKKAVIEKKLTRAIREAIEGISVISYNLSPHIVKNYGLYAALKQFVSNIKMANVVKIHIRQYCIDKAMNLSTEITLYRAITELINNSIKYSGCRNITIDFNCEGDRLYISYTDDGKGFDVPSVLEGGSKGMGLQNISHRINALKGSVSINSAEKNGMQVLIDIPT